MKNTGGQRKGGLAVNRKERLAKPLGKEKNAIGEGKARE